MNCTGISFKNACNEPYSKVMTLKSFHDDDIESISQILKRN